MNTTTKIQNEPKIKVLLEMRPAFDGFAGIPQEVRLLFRGLCHLPTVDVEGMIQTSNRTLSKGIKYKGFIWGKLNASRKINRYSRVVISMSESPYSGNFFRKIREYLEKKFLSLFLIMTVFLGIGRIRLTLFETNSFEDFTWRHLFAKTLQTIDFDTVAFKNFRICSINWQSLHSAGLLSLNFFNNPRYPKLDTEGFDVFIGQTPYPARLPKSTKFVIRYHDAIPVFMPHTIPEKSIHQASHFYALMSNVRSGAWFSCVSEATRQDLIRIFPEAEKKSVVIHNMVSHHYFPTAVDPLRIGQIIRSRLYETSGFMPSFFSNKEKENFYKNALGSIEKDQFLLMVSTIEPRKNHIRLLAAWEVIKSEVNRNIKLVIVGTLGWDNGPVTSAFKPWIDRGELFMLNAVPAPDLRVLYQHAAATVCPSLGEGFDFSGVEAMRSGGVAVASDIPVHREVYQDAAEYFNPYSTMSLVEALKKVIYDKDSEQVRQKLVTQGELVSAQYLPENILPQWDAFLSKLVETKRG